MDFLQKKKLILASKSPRRRELLEKFGYPFSVQTADTSEDIDGCSPVDMVAILAARKAQAVARDVDENALVLGVDTVVVFQEEIFGKPKDNDDAHSMLDQLQGTDHEVYTGLHLVDINTGKTKSHVEKTKVFVDSMTEEEIDGYIATGEPMDKAGAYGIQGRFAAYIPRIEGCYYNVMGLPLRALRKMLHGIG